MSHCCQPDTPKGFPCPTSGAKDQGYEFTMEGAGGDVTLDTSRWSWHQKAMLSTGITCVFNFCEFLCIFLAKI